MCPPARAGRAAGLLRKAGYEKAVALAGGNCRLARGQPADGEEARLTPRQACRGASACKVRARDNPRHPTKTVPMNPSMYTTQVCPYCVRAKALLKQRGVEQIDEIRVDLDPGAARPHDGAHRPAHGAADLHRRHPCRRLRRPDRAGPARRPAPLLGGAEAPAAAGADPRRCPGPPWPRTAIIPPVARQSAAAGNHFFSGDPTMADEDDPVFQIQRMYLKDLSLEQPNSPQILLEQQQPQVDINLGHGAGRWPTASSR
jgi:hypothetical protein